MSNCDHGRLPERCTECAVTAQLHEQQHINNLLRKELGVYKERSDRMHDLVMYAYNRSSKALMMPPERPREARADREQALCDINKKMGGAIR
jgi:hypothetical protein